MKEWESSLYGCAAVFHHGVPWSVKVRAGLICLRTTEAESVVCRMMSVLPMGKSQSTTLSSTVSKLRVLSLV